MIFKDSLTWSPRCILLQCWFGCAISDLFSWATNRFTMEAKICKSQRVHFLHRFLSKPSEYLRWNSMIANHFFEPPKLIAPTNARAKVAQHCSFVSLQAMPQNLYIWNLFSAQELHQLAIRLLHFHFSQNWLCFWVWLKDGIYFA